ncbi:DNA binding protein [Plasmodium gonderi]|uniref:3'-5' exonuclease n=1 Tax=Plasmodium gonderi TaxID=77519 RepID=A0A1Y1JD23_PLAGO|nr:DNA binding protein [Plasmodium gonderi]GAW79117.1 DNA binding protein [Plasmodium gonderi]
MQQIFKNLCARFSTIHTYHGDAFHLSPLKFGGIVIYVHDENICKYEKSIIQYLKNDIIGFDTEFVLDVNERCIDHFERWNVFTNIKPFSVTSDVNNTSNVRGNQRWIKKFTQGTYQMEGTDTNIAKIDSTSGEEGGTILKKVEKNGMHRNNNSSSVNIGTLGKIELGSNKTLCLIQLSTKDLCFVFNINRLKGRIPLCVKEILENEKITKVCHDVRNDKDMFLSQHIEMRNVFDLYEYCMQNYLYPPSLQFLVKVYMKKHLQKHFRLSNWLNDNLNEDQILYAAIDAYASREVYMILKEQDKATQSCILNVTRVANSTTYDNLLPQGKEFCVAKKKQHDIGLSHMSHHVMHPLSAYQRRKNQSESKKSDQQSSQKRENSPNVFINEEQERCNIQIRHEKKKQLVLETPTFVTNNIQQNDNLWKAHTKETEKNTYEYFKKNQLNIINDLKNQINVKCAKMCIISFTEEMVFSNNVYKNRMYLKNVENDECLIMLHSQNYDEEVKCCHKILSYIDSLS